MVGGGKQTLTNFLSPCSLEKKMFLFSFGGMRSCGDVNFLSDGTIQ